MLCLLTLCSFCRATRRVKNRTPWSLWHRWASWPSRSPWHSRSEGTIRTPWILWFLSVCWHSLQWARLHRYIQHCLGVLHDTTLDRNVCRLTATQSSNSFFNNVWRYKACRTLDSWPESCYSSRHDSSLSPTLFSYTLNLWLKSKIDQKEFSFLANKTFTPSNYLLKNKKKPRLCNLFHVNTEVWSANCPCKHWRKWPTQINPANI